RHAPRIVVVCGYSWHISRNYGALMNSLDSRHLSPEHTAIIVIDMLNEYLDQRGKVYCEKCKSIIPRINLLLEFADQRDMLVVFSNTELTSPAQPLAKKWGLHAERGKWGSNVTGMIKEPKRSITVPKSGYDGFLGTDLDQKLKASGITTVG